MNEQELRMIYSRLGDILRQTPLNWVAAEIEQQIEEGKLVERQANIVEENDTYDFPMATQENDALNRKSKQRGKGRKAEFIAVEDYTEAEKVLLLLNGVEAAIDAFNMNQSIIQSLTKSPNDINKISIGGTELLSDNNLELIIRGLLNLVHQIRELVK